MKMKFEKKIEEELLKKNGRIRLNNEKTLQNKILLFSASVYSVKENNHDERFFYLANDRLYYDTSPEKRKHFLKIKKKFQEKNYHLFKKKKTKKQEKEEEKEEEYRSIEKKDKMKEEENNYRTIILNYYKQEEEYEMSIKEIDEEILKKELERKLGEEEIMLLNNIREGMIKEREHIVKKINEMSKKINDIEKKIKQLSFSFKIKYGLNFFRIEDVKDIENINENFLESIINVSKLFDLETDEITIVSIFNVANLNRVLNKREEFCIEDLIRGVRTLYSLRISEYSVENEFLSCEMYDDFLRILKGEKYDKYGRRADTEDK